MLSPNLALREAYNTILETISYDGNPVKVFYGQLPTTIAPGLYIIFSNIRNNDDSDKGAAVTQTSVDVSIYTNHIKYNDGVAVDTVANEVLNRIYRTPQFKITLPGTFFQVVVTQLANDYTQDFSSNQVVYKDRILTFTHTIFQNPS